MRTKNLESPNAMRVCGVHRGPTSSFSWPPAPNYATRLSVGTRNEICLLALLAPGQVAFDCFGGAPNL